MRILVKPALWMVIAAVIAGLGACEKKADNTTAWVGTYNGNGTDSINKVVVSKVNNNTLAIQLVAHTDSAVYTFGMLQNVTVQSPTAIAINENDSLYPFGGDYYSITGNGTLNGNTLTLNDTAKNTVSANPRIIFSFTGSK